ncbi:hypothetical protein BFC17_20170 [Alteromonas lipolytica]|uniref:CHAT domain-containing protein n=2 Tax=Alteromonas lipolytica TaxID=1856405 RepID=A0A1E8FD76_9ALTE|nr:hypothetical protein BFC17_20170 [Alteromonas lipolytica]
MVDRLISPLLIALGLVLLTGPQVRANEYEFNVTAGPGELIVVASPSAEFTLNLAGSPPAYSHYSYNHTAVIAPQTSTTQSLTINVVTDPSATTKASEFTVYTAPDSAAWQWLNTLSSARQLPEAEALLTAFNQPNQAPQQTCLIATVLARHYLSEGNKDQAETLLAPPQSYACWQLAALAMQTYFDQYRFAEASQLAISLLPDDFASASEFANAAFQAADWPVMQDSITVFSEDAIAIPAQTSYLSIRLLLTLGFSNVLHGSTASSQSLMQAGKYSLEQALNHASTYAYPGLQPEIYNGLATYWALANDNAASARYLELAIAATQASDNGKNQAELMNNLALVYLWDGRWNDAQQTLRETYQQLSAQNESITAAVVTANLASSYMYLGDWYTARRYYERALDLSNTTLKDEDTTYIALALAQIAMAQQHWSAAQQTLAAAAQLAETLRPDKLPLIYALQAESLASSNRLSDARIALNQAEDKLPGVIRNAERINALTAIGKARLLLGDYPEAGKTLAQLEALIDPEHPQQITLAALKYQWQQAIEPDNFNALYHTFAGASELVFNLSETLDAYQAGPHWFNKVRTLYDAHLDTLLTNPAAKQINEALSLLDGYKYQLMRRKRSDLNRQRVFSQPATESLWQQRMQLESALVNHSSEQQKQAVQLQLDNLLEQWQHQIPPEDSSTDVVTNTAVNLADIQAMLTPAQAILRYIQTRKQCYVVAITAGRSEVSTISCPPEQTPGASGAEITHQFSAIPAQTYIPDWVLNNRAISDLIWLPDGRFYHLPMALLKGPDGTYVGSRYTLRQTPSLRTYLQPTNDKPLSPFTLGIFDAPTYSATQETSDGWRSKLPPLNWAQAEGDELATLFKPYQVNRYSGADATQQALLNSSMSHATLLHIATHSYFDPNTPEIVGLAVAGNSGKAALNSGFLPQSALLAQHFTNQLVVLSGCETALGREMAHDGLQSLAYGMLSAGADSVISTRWKIADKAAATFMGHFYTHLKTNGNSAHALRYARQQMQHHPRFKHPMHWAGFTLTVIPQSAEQFSF